MDPLPSSVNKIYSMTLKVEKQKLNQVQNTENFEMAALFTKSPTVFHQMNYGSNNTIPIRSRKDTSQMPNSFRGYSAKKVLGPGSTYE